MDRVRIRPISRSDESALKAFYTELSDGARRARFLGCASGLDERCAMQMSTPDGACEAGFVAELPDGTEGRIVGHLSLTQSAPDELELAIAVADGRQHHGIGRHLLAEATNWAEGHDVLSIVATAFTDNWRVLHLLRSTGHATIVRDVGCGLSSVTISINDRAQLKPAA
jgi:GNAT superfamily N-acetyltransferase